jgi:uncharacterized membrane protein
VKLPSVSKTVFRLRRLSRRLWIRTTLIALLALISALTSRLFAPLLPDAIAENLGPGPVTRLLEILASSMLAVTTFSLSVMVSARRSASTQVTPRSYRLLLEDPTTQTVLATFLGAFVFALVSFVLVSTDYYAGASVGVILIFTLIVIALVVISMLRWIDHLTDLGSVAETSRRVEEAAARALDDRRRWPSLGAMRMETGDAAVPRGASVLRSPQTGYVQHVDLEALNEKAGPQGRVYIVAEAGSFVARGDPLCRHVGLPADADLHTAFTLGDARSYDQDPRFGIIVLGEIAQRALSPGVNDPGTAIDVITRLLRLFLPDRDVPESDEVLFPRVHLAVLSPSVLLRDAFGPIARDGASNVEVQVRLQKALQQLRRAGSPEMAAAARDEAERALAFAREALTLDADRERIAALAGRGEDPED